MNGFHNVTFKSLYVYSMSLFSEEALFDWRNVLFGGMSGSRVHEREPVNKELRQRIEESHEHIQRDTARLSTTTWANGEDLLDSSCKGTQRIESQESDKSSIGRKKEVSLPGEYTTAYRGIHAAAWCIEMTADKSVREKIINDFSEWTAFSATRSGCPLKSRDAVYPLIRTPKYHYVLNGNKILSTEFDDWHKESTLAICAVAPILPVGWATKLINIYLKSMVYLAGVGRQRLVECIHPPIDNGLWEGIRSEYSHRPEILSKTHIVHRIKDINTYEKYKTIIHGCRLVAEDRDCYLIEIEELWQGTEI